MNLLMNGHGQETLAQETVIMWTVDKVTESDLLWRNSDAVYLLEMMY